MNANPPPLPTRVLPPAQPGRGSTITSRVLGYFRIARDLLMPPQADEPGPADATGEEPGTVTRSPRPQVLGAPNLRSAFDDQLGPARHTVQPRLVADGGSTGPLTVRAASVCGRRHAQRGETREDAYALTRTVNGAVIMAVADGVGDRSARYSAVGARVASMTAVQTIAAALQQGASVDSRAAADSVARVMMGESRRFIPRSQDYTEHALATTLITAWLGPDGRYRGFMVGDGGVFDIAAGQVSLVASPRGNAYTSTEALPDSYAHVEEFSGRLVPGSALLLATDGLADPLMSPDVARALGQSWQQPPTVLGFLVDISFERKGEHDDRTGAGAWFAPANFDPAGGKR